MSTSDRPMTCAEAGADGARKSRSQRHQPARTLARALWLALLLGLVTGCSGYVKRGSALYADGRYIEAAEVFERTEARLTESSLRQQAEYGLYRGLTLLVLGDTPGARHWLSYAYRVEQMHPGVLRGNGRALLDHGWSDLQSRGQLPPGPMAPSTTAPPLAPMALQLPQQLPEPPATSGPSPAPPAQRSLMPQWTR